MDLVTWATQHKDVLGLLFGSGVLTTAVTALARRRIRRRRLKRDRARGVDKFPFQVITREADLLSAVMPGQDNDPLAPSAIVYRERTAADSTREALADLLLTGEQRWLLLLGRTGTGKTREAVEVARLLMRHGWTVLHLTRDHELDAPATPPEAAPPRKLLFLLDDLNRRMISSRFYDAAGAADPDNPLHVPLQSRLLRTLSRYEQFYGTAEVRVLATARDEETPASPGELSEWDKLNVPRYRELWARFEPLIPLPEPDDQVVRCMLEDTSRAANVPVSDAEALARSNDRTFGNIVANLQRARANGTGLTPANFQGTLQGTWRKRYEDAVQHSPLAREVFGAVSVLRALGAPLTVDSVAELAVLMGPVPSRWTQPLPVQRWRARREVRRLAQAADILRPRDGQIEASGEWEVEPHHVAAATAHVVALSRRHPATAGPHLLHVGRAALMLGHFDTAVTAYARALELNSDDAQAWYGQGKAFAGAGEFARAVECYRGSLDRVSDFYWAWYDLGTAQLKLREFEQATISLRQAQRLRPSDHKAWIARAAALRGSGDVMGAYLEYEAAIALRPNAPAALRGRDEVLALLPEPPPEPPALGAEPGADDHESWFRRGNLLLSQGASAQAAQAYRAALASHPDHADAWYGLGLACMNRNGPEDPITCYVRALRIDPYFYWAHFDLGNARRIAGDHEAAVLHYDRAIGCQREYADAWYGKGLSLAGLGRHREAVQQYLQALQFEPDFPAIAYDLGNSLRELGYAAAAAGDRAAAERCFTEGLAAYEDEIAKGEHAGARHGLGLCHIELGRYEEAVVSIDHAITADPVAAWYWYDRGRALSAGGQHADAVDAFSRALELRSPYPQALYELARAEAGQGHVGKAVEALAAGALLRPERYPDKALSDPAFDAIRGDLRFRGLFENRPVPPVPGGGP